MCLIVGCNVTIYGISCIYMVRDFRTSSFLSNFVGQCAALEPVIEQNVKFNLSDWPFIAHVGFAQVLAN